MKHTTRQITITAIFSLCAIFALTTAASAATLTVTSTGDATVGAAGCGDGCSLREAITSAASGDTIQFNAATFSTAQTINLTQGNLTISKTLTINGPGARLLTVRRNSQSFIFYVNSAFTVSISGLTTANGAAGGFGGSITNFGTLTINNVTVTGDSTPESAVYNQGTMTILNSTISGNSSIGVENQGTMSIANSTVSGNSDSGGFGAGGIYNDVSLTLNNVTVANNTGGGIFNASGTTNIRNTISTGSTGRADAIGAFVSNGNNLVSNPGTSTGFTQPTDKRNVAANLGALTNNGGQTDTHLPAMTSPAINAGNNCVVNSSCGTNNPPVALTNDQRGTGFPRQQNNAVDIGAIEGLAPTAAAVTVSGRAMTVSGRGIQNVIVSLIGAAGNIRTARTTAFGYYRFEDVAAGETYIISASGKRYTFTQPTQVLNILDNADAVNFIANAN